jgi:hypothetical protein
VADFLDKVIDLDGIRFQSVQASDKTMNVALFNKASTVERTRLPKDANIKGTLGFDYEDYYRSYSVDISLPQDAELCDPVITEHPTTLKIEYDTVYVQITAASYNYKDYPVIRSCSDEIEYGSFSDLPFLILKM